ncbi:MAG: DJ-1/PfpI family protein [Bacteroidetes bacterium]|jgi:transcriptional regulator GlxA family with amidase domain|nr:DJ-1/PfpI family protein [Bacteroidota bacterium]
MTSASSSPGVPLVVGILVFPEVDLLDATGPAEVFGAVTAATATAGFRVKTIAQTQAPVRTTAGVRLLPDSTVDEVAHLDLLVIPGGDGSRRVVDDPSSLRSARTLAARADRMLSVCTGARVLAALGLLDGCDVTTHHSAFAEIAQQAPTAVLHPHRRYTDNGAVLTAAGVTAGLDLALHVVDQTYGLVAAEATARYLEHAWQQAPPAR